MRNTVLPEQGRLLITRDAGDRDRFHPGHLRASDHKLRYWLVPPATNCAVCPEAPAIVIPVRRGQVEQHRPRRVADILMCSLPCVSCQTNQLSTVPKANCPIFRPLPRTRPRCRATTVPTTGKVSIDNQARLALNGAGMTGRNKLFRTAVRYGDLARQWPAQWACPFAGPTAASFHAGW